MTTHTALPGDGIITLVGWPDALAETVGHHVRSEYVERYWLGILGPTATWLLRRLSDEVLVNPAGVRVDLQTLAQSLGLAFHAGRHNPFSRGLDRCIMFGLVRHVGNHPHPTFAVRTRVPSLARRQVERLPHALQVAHQDELSFRAQPQETAH